MRSRWKTVAALVSPAVVGLGCPGPAPRPEPAPAAEAARLGSDVRCTLRYWRGTPLEGPAAGPATPAPATSASRAFPVRVRVAALGAAPPAVLEPLAERTRLVVNGHGDPLLPLRPLLIREARFGRLPLEEGEDPLAALARLAGLEDPPRPFAERRGVLVAGVTAAFGVERRQDASDAGAVEQGAVYVRRLPGAGVTLELGLGVARRTTRSVELDLGPERELVLLQARRYRGQPALAFVFQSPFAQRGVWGFAVVVEVERAPPEPSPAHVRAVEACLAALEPAERAVEPAAAELPLPAPDVPAWLARLDDPARRRGGLVLLAASSGAALARDLALAGPTEAVEALASALPDRPGGDLRTMAAIGWSLERAAVGLLPEVSPWARDALDPAAEGRLVRYAGAVDAGWLREEAPHAASLDAWRALLVEENRALLEHTSPATRARAHAWLAARGLAPAGYDPLAPEGVREEALEADLRARLAAEEEAPR